MVTLSKVWSRTAAVSAAIAVFATAFVSAQSPNAAPPVETPTHATLLSESAFARLVNTPRPAVSQSPAPDSPRPSLLRQAKAEMARQAQAPGAAPTPAQGAAHRSWMARHKWAFIVPGIIAGGILGTYGLMLAFLDD